MARKSKRKLNWAPILWLLFVLNTSFGFAFSPITSATKVKVIGAAQSDHERITLALQGLKDKPALRSQRDKVLADLYRRPDLDSAEISQNIFGRAELHLSYDLPVAQLATNPNVVLTDTGILTGMPDIPARLPRLKLFEGASDPVAAIAGRWKHRDIADVCRRVLTAQLDNVTISVAASGNVRLQLGSGAMVKLGAPEYLAAKFEKLARALEMTPDEFTSGRELNLVVPDKPAFGPAEDQE